MTSLKMVASGKPETITTQSPVEINKPIYPRLFNKIVLTLENSLLPESKLTETPSHMDGLDPDTEKDLRILGCELIQTAGILLKLPQVAMATGQVIFQRFFYSKSFVRHNMEIVAMSCLCLASKIEEAPRRIRDVINVFHHIKQVRAQKHITAMVLDQYYTNLKNQIIKAERRVLKELGFCVHVKHPHKLIVMYLQLLKYETNIKLLQMSWNFMNDSLRTCVFMRYQPETIACASIYLSARKLGISLPSKPPWFGLFQVTEDDIIDICYRVMELYNRSKPNVELLEASVEELKKRYMESRNKSKEQTAPPAVTTVDRYNGSHNAWGGFIQRAIPLPLPKDKTPEKQSRSRSRSKTPSSIESGCGRDVVSSYEQRSKKQYRPRSRSRSPIYSSSKKKMRSRTPSDSSQSKHHKSRDRDRCEYYTKERKRSISNDKYQDKYHERSSRNSYRQHITSSSSSKHHRTSGYSYYYESSSSHGSLRNIVPKHRERDHSHQDRDFERSRDRKRN